MNFLQIHSEGVFLVLVLRSIENRDAQTFNPITDGIKNWALLMGGGGWLHQLKVQLRILLRKMKFFCININKNATISHWCNSNFEKCIITPLVIYADFEKRMIAHIAPIVIYAVFGKRDNCRHCSYSHLYWFWKKDDRRHYSCSHLCWFWKKWCLQILLL